VTDWRKYLTAQELARLEELDTLKRALFDERATLHNRAKQRRHRKELDA